MKKRIFSIITALALTITLLPAMGMSASAAGTVHQVSNSAEFHSALTDSQDGDIIEVNGSFVVKNPQSNNDSLVINKSVTIRGGSLTFWYAGIPLGADVTFENITLGLASNMRPAIMANGHTLTLKNVQRDPTARYIHLFCGGQTGATQGTLSAEKQGDHGKIILEGNTNLGLANIYAGSISTDGTNNVFAKPATVTIAETVKGQPIEHIYACGALQTPTTENDWFDYEHEIAPPTPSTDRFKVSGEVTIDLYGTAVKQVDGSTGNAGKYATVTYNGTDYLNDGLVLKNVGGLTVQSGNLTPASGSSFAMNVPLTIAVGATLGLQNQGSTVTVDNFTGGGALALGQSQKLTVAGAVLGTTTVGIGGIFNGHSQAIPTVGSTYIEAAKSTADSFTLAAPASRPDIKLVNSGNGTWTATEDEDVVIVNDFALQSKVADPDKEVETSPGVTPTLWTTSLPFTSVTYASDSTSNSLAYVPLQIKVNGETAAGPTDDTYTCAQNKVTLAIGSDDDGEDLQISTISENENQAVALTGSYVISVTVPADNSGTGQPITRTATLTVKAADGNTSIPVPTANTGLVYNGKTQIGVPEGPGYTLTGHSNSEAGSHKATATLKSGFMWADGSSNSVEITWGIDKADNLNPLPSLSAAAPTAYNGNNGKITGTTAAMEYADNSGFTGARTCAANETTGLAPGDYYVRIAESANYKAGAAVMVTVPQGPVTVTSIAIATPAAKTAYRTGEKLDVTGLTLSVTMSDGKTYTVPAAAGMVSGFNSSTAAASRTLTVTYGGKTVTYAISVTGDPVPGGGGGSFGGGGTSSTTKDQENKEEEKPANTPVYHDIPANAWYNDAVSFVTEKGLMSGTGTNTFAPGDALTRAMLAQILYNNEEKPTVSGNTFTDVQSGAWYMDAISWAAEKGIVSGYGSGQFGPDDSITREQLAVMLWRYAGKPASSASLDKFADIDKAGDYALTALQWAVEKGIISGKGNDTLDPTGNATRAEVAQMLMNYFKYK